jgi:hypothetical protein
MFPVLGKAGGKSVATSPATAPATAVPVPAAKPSFAALMRKHADDEAEAEAVEARRYAEEREAYEKDEKERALLRRLHNARYNYATYSGPSVTDGEEEYTGYDGDGDLDRDAYGLAHKEARPAPSYSHLGGDEAEEEGEWETA